MKNRTTSVTNRTARTRNTKQPIVAPRLSFSCPPDGSVVYAFPRVGSPVVVTLEREGARPLIVTGYFVSQGRVREGQFLTDNEYLILSDGKTPEKLQAIPLANIVTLTPAPTSETVAQL